MKTKAQKTEELKKGKALLAGSQLLIFTDLTKVSTEEMRRLRRELKNIGVNLLVIKKRLLGILLKEKGIEFENGKFKMPVATIFSSISIDRASAPIYKFFKTLNLEKEKILGGYDLTVKRFIEANEVIAIGGLPPREVLLSQLVGQLAAPLTSLLYVLQVKASAEGGSASG